MNAWILVWCSAVLPVVVAYSPALFECQSCLQTKGEWSSKSQEYDRVILHASQKAVQSVPTFGIGPTSNYYDTFDSDMSENLMPPSLAKYMAGSCSLRRQNSKKLSDILSMIKENLHFSNILEVIEAFRIMCIGVWEKENFHSMKESVEHVMGISKVLGEMQVSRDVMLAGILQIVIEMTDGDICSPIVKDGISSRFGRKVLALAEEYNSLPRFTTCRTTTALTPTDREHQLQMLVAMVEDHNTLFIRLADRIHVLRALEGFSLAPQEKVEIAQEALHVYAPLAARMCLSSVKAELEDQSFLVIDPDAYAECEHAQGRASKALSEAQEDITSILNDPFLLNMKTEISLIHRIKSKYQLFMKKNLKEYDSINKVRDALGLRLIVDAPRAAGEGDEAYNDRCNLICHHVSDRIRELSRFEVDEKHFKDYITRPKPNGYQSLHHSIRNKALGTFVEVQIRTKKMHADAELGEAAHWSYKDKSYRREIYDSEGYKLAWRSKQQAEATSAKEFIRMAHQQLCAQRVCIFLQDQSMVLVLQKNATTLDAAFAIHSDVGLRARTVLINGVDVGLNHPLKNGDVVAVVTDKVKKPDLHSWYHMVNTKVSKKALLKYARENNSTMFVCLGLRRLISIMHHSREAIAKKHEDVLDARAIAKFARERTTSVDIKHFLVKIGSIDDEQEVLSEMGKLLSIPPLLLVCQDMSQEDICDLTRGRGLFKYDPLHAHVLMPLLGDVLQKHYPLIEQRWFELTRAATAAPKKLPRSMELSPSLEAFVNAPVPNCRAQEVASYTSSAIPAHSYRSSSLAASRTSSVDAWAKRRDAVSSRPPKVLLKGRGRSRVDIISTHWKPRGWQGHCDE